MTNWMLHEHLQARQVTVCSQMYGFSIVEILDISINYYYYINTDIQNTSKMFEM